MKRKLKKRGSTDGEINERMTADEASLFQRWLGVTAVSGRILRGESVGEAGEDEPAEDTQSEPRGWEKKIK